MARGGSGGKGKGEGETTIINAGGQQKLIAHGILDVIDQVYQTHAFEAQGADIPREVFSPTTWLKFMEAGFWESCKAALISIITVPLAIGVIEKYVPIFGDAQPTLYDQLFALTLAVSLSLGYVYLLLTITNKYIFRYTKKIVGSFLQGALAGKWVITILTFILYHFIYIKALTPENLVTILGLLDGIFSGQRLAGWYYWLLNFREVFIMSSYFILAMAILYTIIPLASIIMAKRRAKKMEALIVGGGDR